jgi:hypothetical protein
LDEEAKQLEKYRKEREASKKKEAADLSKSSWKGAKRAALYNKMGYSHLVVDMGTGLSSRC